MKPDRQDAAILLLLAQWSAVSGVSGSLGRLRDKRTSAHDDLRHELRCSVLPDEALAICEYFELAGVLHSHGLLNEELLFEYLAVSSAWDTVKDFVVQQRLAQGAPRLWENFESLACAHKRLTREYST